MQELAKRYNPKETEERIYNLWVEKELFAAKINPDKRPYSIVIPPPNITGILHMGHALNNTIQDILIRYHRMKGEESLWMPGTDHAGIATQNVVEKAIAREGLKRQDLGREKFLERAWQWKEEYGSTIINQLKRLGFSCDWARMRFTMDEQYSKDVIDVFVRLYENGLIYRGSYIINWCPRCQTALSDEEAPHREINGNLYYLRYPMKGQAISCKDPTIETAHYVIVATTRPETMLGDTAVAVNPKDKRYKKIVGKSLILPLIGREIRIIADNIVDMRFGTGAVKVTPAHDPNDYLLGKRHNLEFVNVMHPDARMNENAGDYEGMDRFEAREVILEDLKEKGLLEKVEPHTLSAGHCYRCHTIIEPYLSKQWFVKMKPLAKPAIEVVKKGKIRFYPKRWTKVYLNWMESIQDWCISRQIWWGHRIPVYYCKRCQETGILKSKIKNQKSEIEDNIIVSRTKPERCPACGFANLSQDDDVLDTWFSSWLWPFATFGQKEDLKYFYPTSVLVTAPEIIFFWVARMIMAGLAFCGQAPFKDVYIHGTVRDDTGTKMSKSLGNIIDPLEIIEQFGADALRFSIISITAVGQDIFLSKGKFELGRNFANKLWNVSRFLLMNLKEDIKADLCLFYRKERLTLPERWILSSLYTTMDGVTRALESYKFNEAANLLYEFIWHKYCDWYVEIAKSTINEYKTQLILFKVLEKSLRMLHPFMPFITEEIWQRLEAKEPIIISCWPHLQRQMIDYVAEKNMNRIIDIIVAIRNIRLDANITQGQKIDVIISTEKKALIDLQHELVSYVSRLSGAKKLNVLKDAKRPRHSAVAVLDFCEIFVLLEGIIDTNAEKSRLELKLKELEPLMVSQDKKLKDKDFIKKAPQEIVAGEKEKLLRLREMVRKIKENIANLS